MKPAICVLFLVIWMAQEQFGYCKSQKFFPNGRYGRSDPSVPLIEYDNNMENIDEPTDPENQTTEKQSNKSFNSKFINNLVNNHSDQDFKEKWKHLTILKTSNDNFLFCLVTNRPQLGDIMKLLCRTLLIDSPFDFTICQVDRFVNQNMKMVKKQLIK